LGHNGLDQSGSREGQTVNSCEKGNESLDRIKCKELFDWLRSYWILKTYSVS